MYMFTLRPKGDGQGLGKRTFNVEITGCCKQSGGLEG